MSPSKKAQRRETKLAELAHQIAALNETFRELADLNVFTMARIKTVEHSPGLTYPTVALDRAQVYEVLYDAAAEEKTGGFESE